MKNNLYYAIGLMLGLIVLVTYELPSTKAKLVVCDVGQGDAILVTKGSSQALIDGGPSSEKLLSCLSRYIPFWDRQIELIVMTNTDADHISGLSTVMDRYKVMHFVTADGVKMGDTVEKMIASIVRNGLQVSSVERGDQLVVNSGSDASKLVFEVLWPTQVSSEYVAILRDEIDIPKHEQIHLASAKRRNLNERSVVLSLLEDNKRVLLMGDAGDQAEKELLKMGDLEDFDYLKVGHHGSRYASTLEFLQKIRPETAIISVGAKNSYGHPTQETLDRLKQVGASIKRTDKDGTVAIEL